MVRDYLRLSCLVSILIIIPLDAFAPWCSTKGTQLASPQRFGQRGGSRVALFAQPHRNVIVLSHNVSQKVADGLFDANNLLCGRVDVLTRCVNSALWVSNGIRKDTSVFLMFFPQNITVEIQGANVQGLNPDERTMALCLQRTLLIGAQDDVNSIIRREEEIRQLRESPAKGQRPTTLNPDKPGSLSKSVRNKFRATRQERQSRVRRMSSNEQTPPGFLFHREDSLEARLEAFSVAGPVLMMSEDGDALPSINTASETISIILGNQVGYNAIDEKRMVEMNTVRKVSLGRRALLTSQCITITHHLLDATS